MAERSVEELASVIIEQERKALAIAFDAAMVSLKRPPERSIRAIDKNFIDAQAPGVRKHLHGMTAKLVHDAAEILDSMDQYAQAIQRILAAHEMLPMPLSSMVRSIHEFALILCPLFDPDLPPGERIANMGALHLANAQGGLDALEAFPLNQQKERHKKIEAVAGIQEYMKKAGYEIHANKSKPHLATGVSWGAEKVSLRDNTTKASERYTPGIHYNWVLGSGATHGRLWYSNGLEGQWSMIVVGAVAPLLDISDLLVNIPLGYAGVDGRRLHLQTHTRRCALLARTSPGMEMGTYDNYRAQTEESI
ncbi:hypothetical protein FQ154_09655 [Paeniglutamicibacter gangotriensis]|uniref:Uncharacterized protein n=1 Tax=Paeniglutamicibacter gangotriensis TaxID=254787 RepID=A0A5B0EE50_9MICC|nr:hypothetical protein [Paeniglutamicibacter gangotriensis]KAA0977153.1 hypothetical protein FQ154_09655 [Paeniglutamicibacter gangotriensis]